MNQPALVLFAVALAVVIVVASVTTLERVNTHTTGLARPHQPLDRAPGEPLPKEQ
jgi:hypothetical protein